MVSISGILYVLCFWIWLIISIFLINIFRGKHKFLYRYLESKSSLSYDIVVTSISVFSVIWWFAGIVVFNIIFMIGVRDLI